MLNAPEDRDDATARKRWLVGAIMEPHRCPEDEIFDLSMMDDDEDPLLVAHCKLCDPCSKKLADLRKLKCEAEAAWPEAQRHLTQFVSRQFEKNHSYERLIAGRQLDVFELYSGKSFDSLLENPIFAAAHQALAACREEASGKAERSLRQNLGRLVERVRATHGVLYVLDSDGETLDAVITHNSPLPKARLQVRLNAEKGCVPQVARREEGFEHGVILNDVEASSSYKRDFADTRSEIAVPIQSQRELLGVLNFECRRPHHFAAHHLTALGVEAKALVPDLLSLDLGQTMNERMPWHADSHGWDLRDVLNRLCFAISKAVDQIIAPDGGDRTMASVWYVDQRKEQAWVYATSGYDFEFTEDRWLSNSSFTLDVARNWPGYIEFIEPQRDARFVEKEKADQMGVVFSASTPIRNADGDSGIRALNLYFGECLDDTQQTIVGEAMKGVAALLSSVTGAFEEHRRRVADARLEHELSRSGRAANQFEIAKRVVGEIFDIHGSGGCSIFGRSSGGESLRCLATTGLRDRSGRIAQPSDATYSLAESEMGYTSTVYLTRTSLRINNLLDRTELGAPDHGPSLKWTEDIAAEDHSDRRLLMAPIETEGKSLGVIRVLRPPRSKPFTICDEGLLEALANRCAKRMWQSATEAPARQANGGGELIETDRREVIETLEAGALLKSYRESQKIPLSRISNCLHLTKLADLLEEGDSLRTRLANWSSREFLEELEGQRIMQTCSLALARALASAYGMPSLMLDSLLSRVICDANLVKQRLSNFRPVGVYGELAQYSVPKERLTNNDQAFAHLTLDPGGVSDVHNHPGDELILVLDGEIEVRLHDMGLRQRVAPGDFVHFFAEQIHSVRNVGDRTARMFIVRRYQWGHGGTRRRISDDIDKISRSLLHPEEDNVNTARDLFGKVVRPYMAQIAPFPGKQVRSPRGIHDSVGLGRFIRQIAEGLGLSENEIYRRGKDVGWKRNQQTISAFLAGVEVGGADHEDLNRIAEILRIPPVLLADFMFPAVPNFVSVRREEDLVKVKVPPHVDYRVPCRHLVGSDVAVTFLKLRPGSEDRTGERSPWNVHPGFELILPLQGKVQVELKGQAPVGVDSRLGEFAHYQSGKSHRVINKGDEIADLFIVRFHSSGPVDPLKPSENRTDEILGLCEIPTRVEDGMGVVFDAT